MTGLEALYKTYELATEMDQLTQWRYANMANVLYDPNIFNDQGISWETCIIEHALGRQHISSNEAVYFRTHFEEGLETIRERFWASLK